MMKTISSLALSQYLGNVVVTGAALEEARRRFFGDIRAAEFPPYIVLLTESEHQNIGRPPVPTIPFTHLHILGPGSTPSTSARWLVVVWNHGEQYRKSVGLPRRDFYVIVTSQDYPGVDKGIMSLDGGKEGIMQMFRNLSEEEMDHVLASKETPIHLQLSEEMVRRSPRSYKAYVRFADLSNGNRPKVAMLAYERALSLNPGLFNYVRKKLIQLSRVILWGPILTQEESADLDSMNGIRSLLLQPWEGEIGNVCRDILWTAQTRSRERITYLGRSVPRFFTWVYPHRLAAMSTPRREDDIDLLAAMGVTTVLTLTAEIPLDSKWFRFKPIRNVYIPTDDGYPPTIAEMDIVYERFRQDADGVWLVHCAGGKGRAGTVVSCLIAMLGYDSSDIENHTPKMDKTTVMRELRGNRPGSIETERQEKFIANWISHRWTAAKNIEDHEEPVTALESTVDTKTLPSGLSHENIEVCFLIGKPGSGKSWLAQSVAKRRSGRTVIINQDENRSRKACEAALGVRAGPKALVILDCCNSRQDDRRKWLALVNSDKPPIAIYFDYDTALCKRRIDMRLGHPVIKAGCGGAAIKQMSVDFGKPSLKEGFSAVLTVSSFSAARDAAYLLGGPINISKFPRTPHLIDLGATTPDDLVLEMESMEGELTIEEKIDGANMGFSLNWDGKIIVQNRSHIVQLTDHPQFKPLSAWLERYSAALTKLLSQDDQFPERYVLYGEWVVAQHSILYTDLPDRFLAFDLYDREDRKFVSRRLLGVALQGTGINQVPLVAEVTRVTRADLIQLVGRRSAFYEGKVEGVYVRTENADRTETVARGKVVRSDFIAGDKHWSKGPLRLNGLACYSVD